MSPTRPLLPRCVTSNPLSPPAAEFSSMAAAISPPSLTEGELFASRRRRRVRARSAASVISAAAARNDGVRISTVESYKRLRRIGQGGFGVVVKARDLRTGEVVAVKSVRDGGGEAVLREAALLAACGGNPAVVDLREVARGSEMDSLHRVMEYVVGPSLYDVIGARRRQGRPFTEPETRRVMAQLLAGARTMHAHGVIHCDLKPGNVLVGEHDGRLKICDLGLAKSVTAPAREMHLQGTPGYMAPEVLLCDEDYGAPVDAWSLGCIMAELVTGQPLFTEDGMCQQLINIIHLLGIPDDVTAMPLGVSVRSQLRDVVPEERLSQAGFDVLRGLLEYAPKDRLTAAAALQMPWFEAKDDDAAARPAL